MFVIVPALLGWYRWSRRRRVQRAPLRLATRLKSEEKGDLSSHHR